MTGRDMFARQIYICLADDMHFIYTIKYGGLTARREYVSASPGDGGALEVDQPLIRHLGGVDHSPGQTRHD